MKVSKIESRENEMNRKAMDRPQVSSMRLVAFDGSRIVDVATLRFHAAARGNGMGPVVCNLWIHGASGKRGAVHTRGTGSVSGCGYCKRSAAADAAFTHAGIAFTTDDGKPAYMHGAGMSVVREALEAIARHFGYSVFHVVEE